MGYALIFMKRYVYLIQEIYFKFNFLDKILVFLKMCLVSVVIRHVIKPLKMYKLKECPLKYSS